MRWLDLRIWLLVVASTFFWGSNFNAGHAIAASVTPLSAAAERFAIALVGFWLLRFFIGNRESTLSGRDFAVVFSLGLIGVFGFNYAFFTALHTTSALNAALIMAFSPMVSLLFSVLLLNTTIRRYQYWGLVAAFSGVALVVTGGKFADLSIVTGDAWMVLACLFWSFYGVGAKKYADHIPSLQFARWTVSVGAVALILAALVLEAPLTTLGDIPVISHWILLYMSLCGTVLAYIFWLRGLYFFGPAKCTIAFNLVPVFTLVVSVVMGRLPNTVQIVGMLLVLAGVLISSGWQPKLARQLTIFGKK